jgi:glycosyltransferase involved in cell wall biosynthesis
MPELVGDDEAGLLVEPTPASVARALDRLSSDVVLRTRLGGEARKRACTYTWERSIRCVLEAYREVLATREVLLDLSA